MSKGLWTVAFLFALMVGIMVSTVVTFLDWRLNPAGLFHSTDGTDWAIVWDTWFSWFAPLFASTFVACTVILYLYANWRAHQ